jgi:hypothetical protein
VTGSTASKPIGLSAPYFDETEEELVLDVIRSGRLAFGPMIEEFERAHTSNTDEAVVGELNRLVVQDNGRGPDSPPDMVSGIPANPGNTIPETCETNTLVPNRVVERGNVQVR